MLIESDICISVAYVRAHMSEKQLRLGLIGRITNNLTNGWKHCKSRDIFISLSIAYISETWRRVFQYFGDESNKV